MSMQINIKQLKEDPTKKGWVAVFDETDAELSSEEFLAPTRGGLGQDLSNANGIVRMREGSAEFVELDTCPIWAPGVNYTDINIVNYRNLLFRCVTPHTSSAQFSDDLSYWVCLDANTKIEFQEAHGFSLYQPVFKKIKTQTVVVQQFTTVGTTSWQVPANINRVDVLLQGGGSGGAHGWLNNADSVIGGSGGAAGVQRYYSNYKVTPLSNITITVPAGGAGGYGGVNSAGTNPTNGGTAYFGSLFATGGIAPNNNYDSGGDNADYTAGGVSGGTQAGGAGAGGTNNAQNGGAGKYNTITGTNVCRGGGGAGSTGFGYPNGVGGVGGGGNPGVSGVPNTGSGGGGKFKGTGGAGGSGVVIVRYIETNTAWYLAKADLETTLGTHVVLEKNADFMLLASGGEFVCQDHLQGLTNVVAYVSSSTAGTYTNTDDQTISNPMFRVIDPNNLQIFPFTFLRNRQRIVNDWSVTTQYMSGNYVYLFNLLLQCTTTHTSTTSIADDLDKWTVKKNGAVLGYKPSHGFTPLTPICLTPSGWVGAVADTAGSTLCTHVVILNSDDYFLADSSGVYETGVHGLTLGMQYTNEHTAGTLTSSPTSIYDPVLVARTSDTVEIVSTHPAEDRSDTTNIDDGFKLIYSKVKTEPVALNVSVPYDGEKYPNLKIVYRVTGFLPGGDNTTLSTCNVYPNNDTTTSNYRNEYMRVYPSSDVSGTPTSSPYYYASSPGFLLMSNNVGGYGLSISEINLITGMPRIGLVREFTKRASGVATRIVIYGGFEWINSASPVTSLTLTIPQYVAAEILIYGRP